MESTTFHTTPLDNRRR